MTERDDGEPDDGLRSLRAAWLAMPDEEPPERGLSELMAAARVKAAEMAKPSLWQRIVDAMRRPPVLALASVVVLVGGAALIGKRGDEMEARAPVSRGPALIESRAAAPEPSAQPPSTVATEARLDDGLATTGGMSGDGPAAREAREADTQAEARPAAVTNDTASAPVANSRRPSPRPMKEMAAAPEVARENQDRRRDADGASTLDGAADFSVPRAAVGEKLDAASTAGAAAAPTTTVAPAAPATHPAPAARAAQLHTQARAAAARGDCAATRQVSDRIAKQDRRYYDAKVARDPSLAACLKP